LVNESTATLLAKNQVGKLQSNENVFSLCLKVCRCWSVNNNYDSCLLVFLLLFLLLL